MWKRRFLMMLFAVSLSAVTMGLDVDCEVEDGSDCDFFCDDGSDDCDFFCDKVILDEVILAN